MAGLHHSKRKKIAQAAIRRVVVGDDTVESCSVALWRLNKKNGRRPLELRPFWRIVGIPREAGRFSAALSCLGFAFRGRGWLFVSNIHTIRARCPGTSTQSDRQTTRPPSSAKTRTGRTQALRRTAQGCPTVRRSTRARRGTPVSASSRRAMVEAVLRYGSRLPDKGDEIARLQRKRVQSRADGAGQAIHSSDCSQRARPVPRAVQHRAVPRDHGQRTVRPAPFWQAKRSMSSHDGRAACPLMEYSSLFSPKAAAAPPARNRICGVNACPRRMPRSTFSGVIGSSRCHTPVAL